jgi:hydrogenase small subunit
MSVEPMMPGVDEVHILWTSEGMSCDGDTISVTNASLPSLEDVVMGAIPGLPKVHLHNKVLSPTLGGDEFMEPFHRAAEGTLGAPFIFVVEGSIPNENINGDGYWTSMGNEPGSAGPDGYAEPRTVNRWIDLLAPKAWAVVAAGTCATYGGIHAMAGNPTGCMGLADYLGWDFRSAGGLPIINVPGCPVQPDNFMETLLWALHQAAGLAPVIPLDDKLRPQWLFGKTVHEGCDRAAYYEQGDFAKDYNSPKCQVKIGCWGPVVNCNVTKRVDGRHRRLPQRGRHLHRLHDARIPGQVHAVHGRAAGRQPVLGDHERLRALHPHDARHHEPLGQQGAEVAPQPR